MFSVSIEFHQGIFAQRYACRYHKEINCPYLLANRNGWLFIYCIEMRIFVQLLFVFSALSINRHTESGCAVHCCGEENFYPCVSVYNVKFRSVHFAKSSNVQ